jgi:predicted transcriptional regulator of viral defense system
MHYLADDKKHGSSTSDRLLALARRRGVLRAKDLQTEGIPRIYLSRLHRKGVLERPSRGVYVLSDADITEHHSLAEASRRVPHGVICLLSALRFHELTTQAPFEVWLAIDRKARMPKVDHPPLRIVRFSGPKLDRWVETHTVEGVPVRVTNPARTVVDCFAYRNKVGLDVALEALRDCLRQKKASVDEITRAAEARHMLNVLRPYLEAIV